MKKPTKTTARRGAEFRSEHHVINVSQLDLARVTFQDDKGRDLLSVNFDRLADKQPMINVNAVGKNGNRCAGFQLFDLVA